MTIKKLTLAAVLAAAVVLPAASPAAEISINIGDRPFYNHGARYWAGDYEMIWVPGHRSHGHWVHGHYRRGEHRRHHDWDRHDDHHHYDGDRR